MKGFVVAGTHSGVGKTVATLAILHGLREAGYDPQPAKGGPDFIDPSHHEHVAGHPSRTLDPWLQGEDGLRRNYHRGTGDVCVVEGMMGLYDGSVASTASVAAGLDLPVVLVVDAAAGMQSVAATALGFHTYADEVGLDVTVAGVIAQRAHGGTHERGIRDALPDDIAYLGRIPPDERLEIPDRHLGLHMGGEAPLEPAALEAAAAHVDLDALVDLATVPLEPQPAPSQESTDARVAVASDEAFCFVYPATLELLRERASVTTFSPVAGDPLPPCDGVYLPGGYPELHAEALEMGGTLEEIGAAATDGLPVFGECGGFMALCETLTTADDRTHDMAGILPADVELRDRYQALDHVELRAVRDGPTASAGSHLSGHEFHYSRATVDADAQFAFAVERGRGIDDGRDGLVAYETLGTYCHVHPESGAFDRFVESL